MDSSLNYPPSNLSSARSKKPAASAKYSGSYLSSFLALAIHDNSKDTSPQLFHSLANLNLLSAYLYKFSASSSHSSLEPNKFFINPPLRASFALSTNYHPY